ncbi:hypothetical protein M622_15280 [Thauera terpenica 58Eu]|uniref:Uncharacterized protein n=1 Tax=Thauera terpenica 58Eu TaxID=1348657 RepID=T0ARX0_9RHOO|nr:hypothetical protein [Thauera terpenica]EPZ15554.1 hypothetical protein M622_15280 [Thauera terpenica 58Eu]
MFDITPDDINQLNDIDLRELVGRLCEAELASRGLSPAAVTWGGNQTAPDGGLDVRVALPSDAPIEGFVPRPSTGFQVKKPDMPRRKILAEMRPTGTIRPVIQQLADDAGAYVIVSSTGSTADGALSDRQNALREALDGVGNADRLRTDFYDRTRLATWVRRHPGLITWVKEKVGRALVGWRPYGPWSGTAEGIDAEYLLDDKLRLQLGKHRDAPSQSVVDAIDELRDELAQAGKIMRLVGLSGVGKTRLVQALFDDRIGLRSLPPSIAVYTNLSDDPDPQPTGLASDIIANRTRAVLIVDNCPPDLHRRLSELCSGQDSTVSVLTVEYDVRDDQPEGTQVITLETSSPELIEKLIRRRYPHISPVDAGGIAEASGGNARIAIALAETVERSDSIAGLSNDELFQRLFRQRQEPNNALLLAAQACSLVYSFEGEAFAGEEAELPRLASLADQTAQETYRLVGELLRRDLVQRRGVWRAVLPHAIANRLAARALDDTPYDLIHQQLIEGGNERLARSFSRRLSFLHDHPKAVAIVKQWLAPDGLLGNVSGLNDLRRAMFVNVAPVLPEAALAALERDGGGYSNVDMFARRRLLSLLRSLAYDALLFERSAQLLSRAVMESADDQEAKTASDTFVSLFTIHLSGTHATIEQRLGVIEQHLKSGEAKARTLGLAALDKVLATNHFGASDRFEFGARSRDFGYTPRTVFDVAHWYGAALMLIEGLALTEGVLKAELRDLLAQNFDGLWTEAGMHSELERLCRGFAADGFWREGWAACRHTMRFDREQQTSESASRLSDLEADLSPSNLPDRVRAMVLGNRSRGLDLECIDVDGGTETASERMEAIARELGAAVAADDEAFAELLPDLLGGGSRAWTFGRGLAAESPDRRATWAKLVKELEQTAPEQRNVHVLCGFMAELWEQDRHLAQTLLDSALDQQALPSCLPELHTAVKLDERGVERLKRAVSGGQVPVRRYRNLAWGGTTDHLAGGLLSDLLLLIANQSDGLDVALEILFMRLFSDRSVGREYEPELLELGRKLLPRVTFRRHDHRGDHELAAIAKACFTGPDTALVAAELARRIKQAVEANEISSLDNDDLLTALIGVQPVAVLDALFEGDEQEQQMGLYLFERLFDHRSNPADAIRCDTLIAWCEADRERRYPLAASIITFARRTEPDGPKVWSEQAKAIIAGAPDPKNVLAVFVERFRPRTWTGSRAALIEANGRLLDSLESDAPPSLMPFVNETKEQLAQLVARERERETKEDRGRDERFE